VSREDGGYAQKEEKKVRAPVGTLRGEPGGKAMNQTGVGNFSRTMRKDQDFEGIGN